MSRLFLGEALTPHSVFWHLGHSEVLVTVGPLFHLHLCPAARPRGWGSGLTQRSSGRQGLSSPFYPQCAVPGASLEFGARLFLAYLSM